MAPDILKTGKPVCFGGTDPKLTKMGNPWHASTTVAGRAALLGAATTTAIARLEENASR